MLLASTKSSYYIAYDLGPYYHAKLVDDIKRSYFRLIIDQTTKYKAAGYSCKILEPNGK